MPEREVWNAGGACMDAGPTPRFQLALLGRFELRGPDGSIDLTSKKLAGLLAYLACTAPQAAVARQAGSPAVGFALRRPGAAEPPPGAYSRLRRVLGEDALIGDGEEISLQSRCDRCDVARFEVLLGGGQPSFPRLGAVGLYKGRLLADIDDPGRGLDRMARRPSASAWKGWRSMPWSSSASRSYEAGNRSPRSAPPTGR